MTTPAALQHGGVLPGVKAKPFGWPTASLDTGCGHHPSAAIRGASRNKITTSQVYTDSGEHHNGTASYRRGPSTASRTSVSDTPGTSLSSTAASVNHPDPVTPGTVSHAAMVPNNTIAQHRVDR